MQGAIGSGLIFIYLFYFTVEQIWIFYLFGKVYSVFALFGLCESR
jgi:hypothetical protein